VGVYMLSGVTVGMGLTGLTGFSGGEGGSGLVTQRLGMGVLIGSWITLSTICR
jgi:hypothetical protein